MINVINAAFTPVCPTCRRVMMSTVAPGAFGPVIWCCFEECAEHNVRYELTFPTVSVRKVDEQVPSSL